jgi:hypothetical protein
MQIHFLAAFAALAAPLAFAQSLSDLPACAVSIDDFRVQARADDWTYSNKPDYPELKRQDAASPTSHASAIPFLSSIP